MHARYHGLSRGLAAERAEELLTLSELSERAEAKPDQLSGGMQRRLLIARALVNDPELVILDEPTTGLDPQARHVVWERLRRLRREGKTLLITTHYMEEAAHLCDELVVMDRGAIVARGAPHMLIREHIPPRVVEVHTVDGALEGIEGVIAPVAAEVERLSDRVLVYGHDDAEITRRIHAAELPHRALIVRDATLEDVFLRLTGHRLTETGA